MKKNEESGSGVSGQVANRGPSQQDDSLPLEIRGAERQLTELLTKWQRQARGLVAVNNIARAVVSSQGLPEILEAAVAEMQDSLGVARAEVILTDPDSGQLTYHGLGGTKDMLPAPGEDEEMRDVVIRVIQSGRSARVEQDPRAKGRQAASSACASLCVPLLVCERVVGAIWISDKLQHRSEGRVIPFDEHDQEVLEGVAAFVAMAVENARLQETTRAQAAAQTLQKTVVTLAHYVNNPLQGMVSAAELLKERLEQNSLLDRGALPGENSSTALLELIIDNAQEIAAVLRLLQKVGLPQSTTYVGSQQMLDIEEKLRATMNR